MATVIAGIDNQIVRDSIRHTNDITSDIFAFFGLSQDNSEFHLNGAPYSGPLDNDDVVRIVQRANSKGK